MKEKQSQISDGGIGNIIAKVHNKQTQKYKMLQLPEETHRLLKEYCAKHGFIMSALISKLVRQEVKRKV